MGDGFCRRAAEQLGAFAVSVEYRLAPEHAFPTPLEDCYAALCWPVRPVRCAREAKCFPIRCWTAGEDVPPLAAPARYRVVSGLPTTWIGGGVSCALHLVPGAYHGFDHIERRAANSRAFLRARM